MMNFSKSKVLVYHNHDLLKNAVDTKLNKRENIQINTNARMNAEKLGWYLYNNMENGLVFGSIILDEDGKESDKWVVDDHDGRYPNVPVKGWKDSDLIYDDGTGKPIPSSLVIKRLRENFKETNRNTWDTVVKMIKSGTDYTPTTPSEDENAIKRLPNEHLPSISDNYIPFTPNNGVSPIAEADFKLAKSSGVDILQTVSKQLSDVQNTIANKAQNTAQNAMSVAQNAAQNASTVAQNTAQNVATVAQNTAQNVAAVAQNAAQNTVTTVSKVADNVGNAIMDFVEGSKPAPSSSTTETNTSGDVKKIVL
jgi:gas vesicle protein